VVRDATGVETVRMARVLASFGVGQSVERVLFKKAVPIDRLVVGDDAPIRIIVNAHDVADGVMDIAQVLQHTAIRSADRENVRQAPFIRREGTDPLATNVEPATDIEPPADVELSPDLEEHDAPKSARAATVSARRHRLDVMWKTTALAPVEVARSLLREFVVDSADVTN
jgi:hypothetical protein